MTNSGGVQIPLWVARIFPEHFQGNIPIVSTHKNPKRRFSEVGVQNEFSLLMPENIPHDTNPATLVTFHADGGQIQSNFMRPLTVVTPAMLTAFPRLGSNNVDENGNTKAPELDLTMKGVGEAQEKFKNLMDKFDSHLLEFMHTNQALLGKKSLNLAQVEMAQRKMFKPRISTKTGRQYPDACTVRYKGRDAPLQVVDKDMNPIDLEETPDVVGFNTIVRAVLKYSGGYCRGGAYGNSWELVCVQVLGQATPPQMTETAADMFTVALMDDKAAWLQLT